MKSPTHLSERKKLLLTTCFRKRKNTFTCECGRCDKKPELWNFLGRLRQQDNPIQPKEDTRLGYQFGYCLERQLDRDHRPVFFWEKAQDRWMNRRLANTLKQILRMNEAPGYWARAGRGRDQAISEYLTKRSDYPFVFKTDIKSYYDSIDQERLYSRLKRSLFKHHGQRPDLEPILSLTSQTLTPRVEQNDGRIRYFRRGIPKGFSTSPILGWYYLSHMDTELMKLPGIQYQRYVDDVLILAQNELDLKFAKRIFFKHLNQDHLKIRPKKTFTGQTTDPLVYLGYVILSHGFAVSDSSVKRLKLNLRQKPQPLWQAYIKRWKKSFKWVPEAHLHRLVQRVQNEILGKINNPHPPAPPSPTQSANSQPKPIPYPQAPKLTQPALSTEVLSEIKTPRDHNASPRFPYYWAIGPPVPRNRNNKKSS